MHVSHSGASLLSLALLHCGNYLHAVIETELLVMFDTNTQPVVIDVLQIEAEARRMRAQVIAQGFASLRAKVAALFTASAEAKLQA